MYLVICTRICHDEIEVVFALESFANNVHMKHAEETNAHTKAQVLVNFPARIGALNH